MPSVGYFDGTWTGIIDRNPAKVTGWQREYQRAEDELDNPRSLALSDWDTLCRLAAALVERSADNYAGWGEVVTFAACRPRASVRCPASVKPTLTAVAGSGPSGARPHPAPAA